MLIEPASFAMIIFVVSLTLLLAITLTGAYIFIKEKIYTISILFLIVFIIVIFMAYSIFFPSKEPLSEAEIEKNKQEKFSERYEREKKKEARKKEYQEYERQYEEYKKQREAQENKERKQQ